MYGSVIVQAVTELFLFRKVVRLWTLVPVIIRRVY